MKVVGHYNDLSPKMISQFAPKLAKGEVAIFKNVGSFDPATGKGVRRSAVKVPATDMIYDKFKKEWVDIAIIQSHSSDGKDITFMNVWMHGTSMNTIMVMGGSRRSEDLYTYLCLSNHNIDNPNRDPEKKAIWYRVDKVKVAKSKREDRKLRWDAIEIVNNMSNQQVKNFFITRGDKIISGDMEEMREKIEEIAEETPEEILNSPSSTKIDEIYTVIKTCVKSGALEYNKETGEWKTEDGQSLLYVPKNYSKGQQYVDKLVEYVLEDKKGRVAYQKLLDQI